VNSSSVLAPGLALVFDLDGVIIDSNRAHLQAWHAYLARFEIPSNGIESRMYGKRNDEIVRDFFGGSLGKEEIWTHSAAKEALFRDIVRPRFDEHLVPGVPQFLEKHRGAPMAVASNAERANVDFVLETGGLSGFFQVTIGGLEVGRPKPDPEIYFKSAALLGVPPANCIVFEDSEPGVEAALAACMRVVGVRTTHAGFRGASLTIHNFLDPRLEPWLAGQQAFK
jgi:HAD superfamily hydrolase (TIGR01509 family)